MATAAAPAPPFGGRKGSVSKLFGKAPAQTRDASIFRQELAPEEAERLDRALRSLDTSGKRGANAMPTSEGKEGGGDMPDEVAQLLRQPSDKMDGKEMDRRISEDTLSMTPAPSLDFISSPPEKPVHVVENDSDRFLGKEAKEEVRGGGRRGAWGITSRPNELRKQGAQSDLWQHQGQYRVNRRSMASMYEEFFQQSMSDRGDSASSEPARIADVYSHTVTGYKHIIKDAPSEDRLAVHTFVVPVMDDESRDELGISEVDAASMLPFSMFAVFDGHGGPSCAEFLCQNVADVMARDPVLFDEDLAPFQKRAIATSNTFSELERVHCEWAQDSGDLSGSTAILGTYQDGILVLAGIGDSGALFSDSKGKTHYLCPRHSTSNQKEVERVLSMGGTIINGRVGGSLMPTRTLGDLDCKQALGDVVSPHPDLSFAEVLSADSDMLHISGKGSSSGTSSRRGSKKGNKPEMAFLVLASDGLWDVMSEKTVADFTRKQLKRVDAAREKRLKKAMKKMGRGSGAGSSGDLSSSLPGGSVGSRGSNPLDGSRRGSGMDRSRRAGSMDGSRRAGTMDGSRRAPGLDGSRRRGSDSLSVSMRDGDMLDVSHNGNAGGLNKSTAVPTATMPGSSSMNALPWTGSMNNLAGVRESAYEGGPVTGGALGHSGRGSGQISFEEHAHRVSINSQASASSISGGDPNEQDNVAASLVRAAIRNGSTDDISVIVVTFQ